MDLYISKTNHYHAFCGAYPPVASCKSGDEVIFQTDDAMNGMLTESGQTFSELNITEFNPITGPLYIEGAKPGDILKVDILKINMADTGSMHCSPTFGPMQKHFAHELGRRVPIVDGRAVLNDKVSIPVDPMIGVIGTAPAEGTVSTDDPGPHGGNMDCKEIKEGVSLYLPVAVEGALLSMGDVHALMGDGESLGNGIEIPAEVTVRVTVIKGKEYPLPMIVSRDKVMHIYSHVDLDEAAAGAINRTLDFLVNNVGMDVYEAGMYLSMVGNVRICQVVDPLTTCRMEISREILKAYAFEDFDR